MKKSLFALMVAGCIAGYGSSSDGGNPVNDAEAQKAAEQAAQDVNDSLAASKKLPMRRRDKSAFGTARNKLAL